jgi:formylglycine-generating enzyme required for sulfatase activity
MGSNPSGFKGPNRPVEQVSWNDAQEFIAKLNAKNDGYRYRLPTEAEWEYAARAGTTGAYAGDLDAMGWYDKNSGGKTHLVATKTANAWGLYDMHGNVWEWVQDWYGDYSAVAVTDPVGPNTGSFRVYRGGSWSNWAQYCRSALRDFHSPDIRYNNLGFRLLRTSP